MAHDRQLPPENDEIMDPVVEETVETAPAAPDVQPGQTTADNHGDILGI